MMAISHLMESSEGLMTPFNCQIVIGHHEKQDSLPEPGVEEEQHKTVLPSGSIAEMGTRYHVGRGKSHRDSVLVLQRPLGTRHSAGRGRCLSGLYLGQQVNIISRVYR